MPAAHKPKGVVMMWGEFAAAHPETAGAVAEPVPAPTDPAAVAEGEEMLLLKAAAEPKGLGDRVKDLIHLMGADRAWAAVQRMRGITEECGGCEQRRQALNRLEGWVKGIFSR